MDGPNERRIVLLGKTGVGKSSLGNIILGDSLLKTKLSPDSKTSECQAESKTVNGIRTTVIDTPGFFDTNMSEEKLKAEIVKCLAECAPGPHAFLIVLKLERYSDQEKPVIDKINQYFSEEALKHAVIVFTHGDDLSEGMKIEDFVRKSKDLSDLVKKCNDRCYVFDNKRWNNNNDDDYRSNQYQVKQLLNTVDKMRLKTGYYTNEMLQAVDEHKKKNPEGTVKWLIKIFAGFTVGALLGALCGAATFPANMVLSAIVGGIAGGCIGGVIGATSSTVKEAVEETIDIANSVQKALKLFDTGDPPKKDE